MRLRRKIPTGYRWFELYVQLVSDLQQSGGGRGDEENQNCLNNSSKVNKFIINKKVKS